MNTPKGPGPRYVDNSSIYFMVWNVTSFLCGVIWFQASPSYHSPAAALLQSPHLPLWASSVSLSPCPPTLVPRQALRLLLLLCYSHCLLLLWPVRVRKEYVHSQCRTSQYPESRIGMRIWNWASMSLCWFVSFIMFRYWVIVCKWDIECKCAIVCKWVMEYKWDMIIVQLLTNIISTWFTQTTAVEKESLSLRSWAPNERSNCALCEACSPENSTLKSAAMESTTTSFTRCWVRREGSLYCSWMLREDCREEKDTIHITTMMSVWYIANYVIIDIVTELLV